MRRFALVGTVLFPLKRNTGRLSYALKCVSMIYAIKYVKGLPNSILTQLNTQKAIDISGDIWYNISHNKRYTQRTAYNENGRCAALPDICAQMRAGRSD